MGHEGKPLQSFGTWLKGIDKLRARGIFGFIMPLLLVGIECLENFFWWAFAMQFIIICGLLVSNVDIFSNMWTKLP